MPRTRFSSPAAGGGRSKQRASPGGTGGDNARTGDARADLRFRGQRIVRHEAQPGERRQETEEEAEDGDRLEPIGGLRRAQTR
ncbi:MAG: hypothetical protein WHT06_09735 [Desulfobacterales bacterium]